MSDVMDIMLKIGITEEVTRAFHGISALMEKVLRQTEMLTHSFTSAAAAKGIGTVLGGAGVGIIGSLMTAVVIAGNFEKQMSKLKFAGIDTERAFNRF